MESGTLEAAVRGLVDDYRSRCLWFLREDYYPATDAEREHVLRLVERHGDLDAFRRAAAIRSWLSLNSSGGSSVS